MENCILVVILVACAAVGVWYTVKHFRRKGGCCGGGGYRARPKKLSHVAYTKTFHVEGMHCAQCQRRVEEIVGDIQGLAGRADWKRQQLTVQYATETDDAYMLSRLEKAGYTARPM